MWQQIRLVNFWIISPHFRAVISRGGWDSPTKIFPGFEKTIPPGFNDGCLENVPKLIENVQVCLNFHLGQDINYDFTTILVLKTG